MKNKINLPGYTAETNTIQSYRHRSNRKMQKANLVFPSIDCSSVNCAAAIATCALIFNPISCSLAYDCCANNASESPSDPVCQQNPCQRGCPPSPNCPLPGVYNANLSTDFISDGFSNLSSQIASLKKQLNRIERCTCGLPSVIYNVPEPSISYIPREYGFSPYFPIPPSPY